MLGFLVYFLACWIIISFLLRHGLAHHANNPAAAGLAVLI